MQHFQIQIGLNSYSTSAVEDELEFLSCVWHVKLFESECSLEAFLSCQFSISFQNAYKSAFLVRFVISLILHIAAGEFLGCMVTVELQGM